MGFTLWALLKASLLVVNALAILHEERFLKPSASRGGWFRGVTALTHGLRADPPPRAAPAQSAG